MRLRICTVGPLALGESGFLPSGERLALRGNGQVIDETFLYARRRALDHKLQSGTRAVEGASLGHALEHSASCSSHECENNAPRDHPERDP
jgi:hypothetical protein